MPRTFSRYLPARPLTALLLLAALGGLARAALAAGPLQLAREGRTGYVIALPPAPTATERLAAEELAGYLHRITGADFPVGVPTSPPKQALVLSGRPQLKEPLPGPDAYRIEVRDERVYLTGGRGRGLLFAAYDFLGRLGCRWLAPEFEFYHESAELVPRSPSLAYSGPERIDEKPVLGFRKLYVEEGHSHTPENLAQLVRWMPKLRFNTLVVPLNYQGQGRVKWDNWREKLAPALQERDLQIEVGGHGYQNFLNAEMEDGRLFEQHPEYFGQDAAGKRRREHAWGFCTSNSEALRYVADHFIAYVQARPEIQIFDFWPPDGVRWCECEPCRKQGSPADRQAYVLNQIRPLVAKARPDLRLEGIAYQRLISPPEQLKLDPEVLIDFCPIGQSFESQINEPASPQNVTYWQALQAWRKAFAGDLSYYSYYRKYAWKSLPVILPHYMQRDLQAGAKVPIQGVSSYAEPGDWGGYELNHFMLGQLAWNPDAPVDDLLSGYCEARYGSGAEVARAAYGRLEDVVRHHCGLPGTSLKPPEPLRLAGEELDAQIKGLRQAAASHAAAPPALERLRLACEYARRDVGLQESRARSAPAAERRKQVEELLAFLRANAEKGVFLLHARLDEPRLLQSYGLGTRGQ